MIDLMPGFGAFTPASGGGGGATATWNPADKNANVTLSSGNLVATKTGGGYSGSNVRSTLGKTTGKYYSEHVLTFSVGAEYSLNIANASAPLDFYGGGNDAIGYYADGTVYRDDALLATIAAVTSGQRVCQAVDVGAGLVWWRVGTGNWNNDGGANPATGVGGLTMGITGAVYVMLSMYYEGEGGTADFASGSWSHSAPAGFGQWV